MKSKKYNSKALYFSDKLKEVMEKVKDYPLTIIEAPMGYGKTTAVKEYFKNFNGNVFWQRVYDSSLINFWSGFCNAFNEIDKDKAQKLESIGFPNDSVSLRETLNIIGDMEFSEKSFLIIDDYHIIENNYVDKFLELLIKSEIYNFHIVLTARFVEIHSVDELKLKGYLHHINKESFEFIPEDIINYYKLCGIVVKSEQAYKLYSLSEGWISALYLIMLNFIEGGNYVPGVSIYNLIEKAVYVPFSNEIKEFLLSMCIFESFTFEQALFMWQKENVNELLTEITRKNAFIKYDAKSKTYQMHNILTDFLKDMFQRKDKNYKQRIFKTAAQWHVENHDYIDAMNYFFIAEDFHNFLNVVELDKADSINSEHKEIFIKYFEECPEEYKLSHPIAMLIYARRLFTFNETALFKKVCGEILNNIETNDSFDAESKQRYLGEYNFLLSFPAYNDIAEMSKCHQKAWELLKGPSEIMSARGSWTFGSPSVLYMFYRKSTMLEEEVNEIMKAMPYYYALTNGHGNGAEYVMGAEWYFNQGKFEDAAININKALYFSNEYNQTGIMICARFLQVRIAIFKGDYAEVFNLFEKMREHINGRKLYLFMHTLDTCEAYIYSYINQKFKIHSWILEGEFNNSRLMFPAKGFLNIVYGRVLLINGEYLKLIGSAEYFIGVASVFPNLLSYVYTYIYLAAANNQIFREIEALFNLNKALEIAISDKVYMPFVENCDYIEPLLKKIYLQGMYCEDITKIFELYEEYEKSLVKITKEYFSKEKPELTEREREIAVLAAQGLTNKEIAEQLFISQNTVKTQLKNIFDKLGINSRVLLKKYLS